MQYKGKDLIGDTYTKARRTATQTKEADTQISPELRKKALALMKIGYTDAQIREELQDMNDPLLKTLHARTLEYIRRNFRENITPEQAGYINYSH